MHPFPFNKIIRSYGSSFVYEIMGPVCRLYDREELPWPSSSLQWRGKQPSWNRQGTRLVADLAANRCPSYAVKGYDHYGNQWEQVISLYDIKLNTPERRWWVWKGPSNLTPPITVEEMEERLEAGKRW